MAKIYASIAAFSLAFTIGVAVFALAQTMRNTPTRNMRSCQVKLIQSNGHIVWMSCEEWKKATDL